MQVILDSLFARLSSIPIKCARKREFMDWTRKAFVARQTFLCIEIPVTNYDKQMQIKGIIFNYSGLILFTIIIKVFKMGPLQTLVSK